MLLSEITDGQSLSGLEPDLVCRVVAVKVLSEAAAQVYYELPDGQVRERLLTAAEAATITPAAAQRPWSFDGDGEAFKLACEAKRIDLAFLFDPMMAVHTSNVDPLPHQITAVYESLLPRQPLRFVLADDPGAGKTIMAGLYIRELIMRADAERILIVAPGSLVEQWRDELFEKFGLDFKVYSTLLDDACSSGNAFDDHPRLIARLDQLSRAEEGGDGEDRRPGPLQEKVLATDWDLVVFDEAHKLSAHYDGQEIKRTGRFRFAERLGAATRHFLLMTATPHNGKEADFQLFMSLLDSDRFYGKFRDGVHKDVDTSDLMRRMVKEELVKFDGTPLFPERRANTVNYSLSELEVGLYEAVTNYVKNEMGKADELADGRRRSSVGFALTSLQRRLASSPEAIYQSLKRRRERLAEQIREEKVGLRGKRALAETFPTVPEDDDDLNAAEQEELEEALIDQASAARTIEELESEVILLQGLEDHAKQVVASGEDRKWEELSRILQNRPEMRDADGRPRKIIIFTEHKDTLHYLVARIGNMLGNPQAIVTIHGGTPRDERRKVQALFRSDPEVRVLVATDAAGEGVNLQCANLMVNYDLPWNPNRLEQRFGRIHRIGQPEVCHLWSLVAKETREGAVWDRLLDKLEIECIALKGKVFNILGDVFDETPLRDLMIEAIRYGNQPEVRARLTQKIDHVFDHGHLESLLSRNALAEQTMSPERLFKVKDEMDKAEARRLQPHFVKAYFEEAFDALGGTMHRREAGRYEITHVPQAIRERDRRITGRNRREQEPVLKRYDRVCFERAAIQPLDQPNLNRAVLLHPGHPLMLAVTDLVLEQHANLLRQGSVLVDPADDGHEPWLLLLLTHEVKSGDGTVLSKRMQFVKVTEDGRTEFAGWAPHFGLEPLAESDRARVDPLLDADWIRADLEQRAIAYAAGHLVPEHFEEVAHRRHTHVDKTLAAVHERLTAEINFWTDREIKIREDKAAGKDVRLPLENATRRLRDLQDRLAGRKKSLLAMREVQNSTPVILGGSLVIPNGLLRHLRGETPAPTSADADARRRVEMLAMQAVIRAEEAMGHTCEDVSAQKCGWDITSRPPSIDGRIPTPRHIEVKGRVMGADTVTITTNEIMCALNQADKFVLAIVFVDGERIDGPHYVRNPFQREPDRGAASTNYRLADLLELAEPPASS